MDKRSKITGRNSFSLCLLIFITTGTQLKAQLNYVLNPSFEQYWRCPETLDEIKFANYWSPIDTVNQPPIDSFGSYFCTPEYCNTCSTSGAAGVPNNQNFYHYPRTGNGMAQEVMFSTDTVSNPYQRDYLQGKLYKPLTVGKAYCVTFFVTLEQQVAYAVNHIGSYLDNGIIDTTQNCGLPQITHIPQVFETNVINDTLNWHKIEGSFIADGTEKYITIGNFYNNAHTSYIISNPYTGGSIYSAYLVDVGRVLYWCIR